MDTTIRNSYNKFGANAGFASALDGTIMFLYDII